MDDTQFRLVLAEMKESNKLMKAMVSELSQIKFELVNERLKRESGKIPHEITKLHDNEFVPVVQTGPNEYILRKSSESGENPPIPKEHALDVMK